MSLAGENSTPSPQYRHIPPRMRDLRRMNAGPNPQILRNFSKLNRRWRRIGELDTMAVGMLPKNLIREILTGQDTC